MLKNYLAQSPQKKQKMVNSVGTDNSYPSLTRRLTLPLGINLESNSVMQ